MRFVFIVLFLLPVGLSFSQGLSFNQSELLKIANTSGGVSATSFDNQYADVSGSPYFSDEWLPAKAVMTTGKTYSGLRVKVNFYQNKVYMNQNDTIFDITAVPALEKIVIYPSADTSQKAVFPIRVPEAGKPIAAQQLTQGKISLYKVESRAIEEMQTGLNTAKEKVFTKQTDYFLVKDGGRVDVKLSKKSLERIFTPDEWNRLTRIASEQKLSLTSANGLAAAITRFNEE